MPTSYPRKQTTFIFIICTIIVAAIAFYVYSLTPKNTTPADASVTTINTDTRQISPIINDTDWQKSFYENSTTSTFKAGAKTTSISTPDEQLTATDIMGRNFFTKYTELRQAGLTKDTKAVTNAANQVIAESLANVEKPKAYTFSDIKIISSDGGQAVVKAYAENLMKVLKSAMPEKNEAEIAMTAFEKGDMTLLKGIDPVITGYQLTLNGLVSLPVPQPLAQYHLDLLNAISIQLFNAKSLRKADTDPITALAAVSLETKSLQAISTAVGNMQTYFSAAGIVFAPPVSGSILQSQ